MQDVLTAKEQIVIISDVNTNSLVSPEKKKTQKGARGASSEAAVL